MAVRRHSNAQASGTTSESEWSTPSDARRRARVARDRRANPSSIKLNHIFFNATTSIPWEEIGFLIGGFLVFYILIATALHALAKREGVARRWPAWVPLAQWFLLVEIGQKPKRWGYFIFLPIVLVLSPAFIDMRIFPDFLRIIIGAVAGLSVVLFLVLFALVIAAIAKRQGRAAVTFLGILAAFLAFPAGLAVLSMLAWGKITHNEIPTENRGS